MQSVYDEFSAFSYVAYWRDAICNDIVSYKWLPIRTTVAAVYFQLGTLFTQRSRIVREPCYVAQCSIYVGRNKECGKYELVSGSGPFLGWIGRVVHSCPLCIYCMPDGDNDFQSRY